MAKNGNGKIVKVVTPEFRVCFPAVFKPEAFEEGAEPKYGVTMVFPKGTDLTELKRIATKAKRDRWGDNPPANLRNPFRDGKEKAHLEGFGEDTIFVAATTKHKPGLIDRRKDDIVDPEDFYAGCYARATVSCYAYDHKGNRGVAFGLHNVQKLRDGETLSGKTSAREDFDEAEELEDDDDLDDEISL